jgi:hypothetical protein
MITHLSTILVRYGPQVHPHATSCICATYVYAHEAHLCVHYIHLPCISLPFAGLPPLQACIMQSCCYWCFPMPLRPHIRDSNRSFLCWQVANSRGTLLAPKVVEEVAERLFGVGQLRTSKAQELPPAIVSRASAVDEVVKLLTDEGNRQMVLLHGMAGSGKSTLAKVVFNRLHNQDRRIPCCFVDLKADSKRGLTEHLRMILTDLAFRNSAPTMTLTMGRSDLSRGLLKARKVLLVVDNVEGDQLDRLLPTNIMELLGAGSMVLVTSCDRTAVSRFAGGCTPARVEVDRLSDEEAWEMWCGLQATNQGTIPLNQEEEVAVKRVLARCGGLPLAIKALSSHLKETAPAAFKHQDGKAWAQEAYEACSSLSQLDLLGAIKSSCEGKKCRQTDLLDIVWFFRKRPWEVADRYCTKGALVRLEDVGLVKRCKSATDGVVHMEVHQAVKDYCKTDPELREKYKLFHKLQPEHAASLVTHARVLWSYGAWGFRCVHAFLFTSCLGSCVRAGCRGMPVRECSCWHPERWMLAL